MYLNKTWLRMDFPEMESIPYVINLDERFLFDFELKSQIDLSDSFNKHYCAYLNSISLPTPKHIDDQPILELDNSHFKTLPGRKQLQIPHLPQEATKELLHSSPIDVTIQFSQKEPQKDFSPRSPIQRPTLPSQKELIDFSPRSPKQRPTLIPEKEKPKQMSPQTPTQLPTQSRSMSNYEATTFHPRIPPSSDSFRNLQSTVPERKNSLQNDVTERNNSLQHGVPERKNSLQYGVVLQPTVQLPSGYATLPFKKEDNLQQYYNPFSESRAQTNPPQATNVIANPFHSPQERDMRLESNLFTPRSAPSISRPTSTTFHFPANQDTEYSPRTPPMPTAEDWFYMQ